jgi:hypothetical protein
MIPAGLYKCLNFNAVLLPARVGTGLGGHPAVTMASDATPNGEALAWVVVVGRGLQAIEDSIGSPLILV